MSYLPTDGEKAAVAVAELERLAAALQSYLPTMATEMQHVVYGAGVEPAQAIYDRFGPRSVELLGVCAAVVGIANVLARQAVGAALAAEQTQMLMAAMAAAQAVDAPHSAAAPLPTAPVIVDGQMTGEVIVSDWPEPEPEPEPEAQE